MPELATYDNQIITKISLVAWSGRAPLSLRLLERDPGVHRLLTRKAARRVLEFFTSFSTPVFLTGSSFAGAVPKKGPRS